MSRRAISVRPYPLRIGRIGLRCGIERVVVLVPTDSNTLVFTAGQAEEISEWLAQAAEAIAARKS